MNCKICGKELTGRKKVFCSPRCNSKNDYLENKERYKLNSAKWKDNNPEKSKEISKKSMYKFRTEKKDRFNKLVLKSYYKHKSKWHSRSATHQVLRGIKRKTQIEKKCLKCGSENNLKLNFEIYPITAKDIRQAINDKKIYYLCQECRLK
jgi:hypothetical protein